MAQTGGLLQKLKARAETALKGQREAMKIFAAQTVPSLQQTQGLLQLIRKDARANIMTDQVMLDSAQGTRFQVSLISVITVVVGILLAFLMIRGINAVLLRITNELGQGASQVASASSQVSSASQSLAEGAAQQAAQLEETSASVEEMASMTRQNADSAQQANSLMDEAGKIVGEANTSMKHLKEAWVFCALWWKGIGRQQTVREISNSSNLPKRK